MVLDGALGDEELSGDLSVRGSLRGEARDLLLLGSELVDRIHGPFAGALAGRQQLPFGAGSERFCAHASEHLSGGAQMLSGVETAALASQPLPVKEVGSGKLKPHTGTGEVHDRLAVQALGDLALAQQCAHTSFELHGKLLGGASADWQIVLPDGTALGDIRYTLQTDTGELLYVQSRGVRHGSAEILARLARGEDVDAGEYIFRTSTQIETAAPALDWLNKGVFISVGGRQADGVIYETYLVE